MPRLDRTTPPLTDEGAVDPIFAPAIQPHQISAARNGIDPVARLAAKLRRARRLTQANDS